MKKHRATFRTFYLLYVLLLIIALVFVYSYVRKTLVAYENSGSEQTAIAFVKEAAKGNSALAQYLEKNCFDASSGSGRYGDPAVRKARFESTAKNAKLSVTPAAGSYDSQHPVYNVLADGKPFLTLGLEESGTTTKLGILTLSEWDVTTCVLRADGAEAANLALGEDGKLSYTVSCPDSFSVYIDGKEIPADVPYETSGIDDFQYVEPFVAVPQMATRTFSGLTFEPTFTIYNNAGEPVAATVKNGVVTCEAAFASTKAAEELGSKAVDALAIGELWSKFMTNDVGGDARGLYTVRNNCRLLPGSDLYKKATSWANNIDITFVSGHSIDSFTGERVSNYVIYNEDLFSCDVYFEKNMTLKNGAKRTDVFHNRLFFVNNKDAANGTLGWRLADMFAL